MNSALRQAAVFDGVKTLDLNTMPEDAWRYLLGHGIGSGELTPEAAYKSVPWVYRAVTLRAQGLADIPWAVLRGETEVITSEDLPGKSPPKDIAWVSRLNHLLYRTEMAVCIWGAAYWFRERNRVRTLGYRWLLPASVTPQFDSRQGLVGFSRKVAGEDEPYRREDFAYWWLPSVEAELGPGTSPVQAALRAAGLVHNVDLFSEGFFKRGAVNLTLLSVEGNPASAELDKLERWWKRLVAGVRKAWESVAIRASVKPVVIGSPPKDLAMGELTDKKREDIATALGIPYSIVFSNASNFATAEQDDLNFYTKTLLPEAEWLETGLNEQVFSPLGYEFAFQPKKMEIFQSRESEKAYSLVASWQAGLLKKSEWREQMGLEVQPGDDVYIDATGNTKVPVEHGSDAEGQNELVPQVNEEQAKADRGRWQRKALRALERGKSPNVPFASIALEMDEQVAIRVALAQAATPEEVVAAFAAPFREGDRRAAAVARA